MTALLFKIDDKITEELDLIREKEGLGNRTATFAFLIKYYLLTQKHPLSESIELLEHLAKEIDWSKVPSLKEQLKDL